MSEVFSDNWKALAADPELARARSRLSMHELRLIMRHGGIEHRQEIERLRGTLSYLKTQAENGTLHPQVVIQNVSAALGEK
jgi:hypothetical protein